MPKIKDMTGQVFGRLTVIGRSELTVKGLAHWVCRCECGEHKTVSGASLRRDMTKSCGCWHREVTALIGRKHIHQISSGRYHRSRLTAQNTQFAKRLLARMP